MDLGGYVRGDEEKGRIMRGQYRSVNFDLDTKAMQEVLGSKTKGYSLIKKSMKEFGFSHRQGSGYRSEKPMTRDESIQFAKSFGKANPWLTDCVKAFDVTNSGRADYDFTDTVKNAARSAQTTSESVSGNNEKETTVSNESTSVKAPLTVDEFMNVKASEAAASAAPSKGNAKTMSLSEFLNIGNENVMD